MSTSSKESIAAFFKAVKSGDTPTVRVLLAADRSLVTAVDRDGSTGLHHAAWKGHAEVAAVLLDAGSDVNAQNTNEHWGTTPLHAAAHANQRAVAQLLLERGARPSATNLHGRTPLEETTFHGATAVARLLRQFNRAGPDH